MCSYEQHSSSALSLSTNHYDNDDDDDDKYSFFLCVFGPNCGHDEVMRLLIGTDAIIILLFQIKF